MVDPIKLVPTPPPKTSMPTRAPMQTGIDGCSTGQRRTQALGLDKAVAAARSIEDLRRIALDVDSAFG